MKAAQVNAYGNPLDVVTISDDVPAPIVGPDTVLIDVAGAGVNPVDWKIVLGYLQGAFPSALPLTPGWDVAGVVAAVGPAVTTVAVGDRVAAYARKDYIQHGTFAEQVAVPDRSVAKVPDGVDLTTAAGLPLAGLTAQQLLDAAEIRTGDTVLVHAAAGGVGSFVFQLATGMGARVVGTASSANAPVVDALGGQPVDYAQDLVAQVRSLAPSGVDAVVDLVGGDTLAMSPQLLAQGGRIVSVTDAAALAGLADEHGFRSQYVFVRPDREMLARLLRMVDDGTLRVPIAKTYPLDQAAEALEDNRGGHTTGKIIITV